MTEGSLLADPACAQARGAASRALVIAAYSREKSMAELLQVFELSNCGASRTPALH